MNILSIQSHVVHGHVGNAAAVFPLQRLGHEVWPLHTVQFSNHPGYGGYGGRVLGAAHIREVIDGLADRDVLGGCDAVLSGYMGDGDSGAAVLEAVARVRAANPDALYACDPVMGDSESGLFVRPEIPALLRDRAVPAADILSPNLFELQTLTGARIRTLAEAVAAAQRLRAEGPSVVLVTSLRHADTPEDAIEMLAVARDGTWRTRTPLLSFDPAPNGGGDLTAALFLGHYLRSRRTETALEAATAAVFAVMAATRKAGTRELQIVAAQDEIVRPARRFSAERLD